MINFATQLQMATACNARLVAEKAAAEAKACERNAKISAAREKSWAVRKGEVNYLREALLQRLPQGKEAALSLAGVEALFADAPARPTGISSLLSRLFKEGLIVRFGERFSYRYYLNP